MDLHGIGPSGAARLLVEVGDITRFPNRAHFASWNATAAMTAGPGGHRGTTTGSNVTDSHPQAGSSEKLLRTRRDPE
ncbi:IS110 family transposase [Micromonospora sp. 15K316]|uniref:IS110 family transposase n=1 Tax=Micromonospora sp. 15K316 TaxID=2530376 RepID=UPI001FB7BA56|nr:IS110 family transposase [Micromonospora sp. 15K316]